MLEGFWQVRKVSTLERDLCQLQKSSEATGGPQMPTAREIVAINKTNSPDSPDRITRVAGTNPDGTRWVLSQLEVISGIEKYRWRFFVNVGDKQVGVVVATDKDGRKYLKATTDGEHPLSLLKLPEFL
jgi:hypothetical protein